MENLNQTQESAIETTVTDNVVALPTKENKKSQSRTKKTQKKTLELRLDAGSANTKFYFDKTFKHFPSIGREFTKGEALPQDKLGVFSYKGKGYAIGKSAKTLSGGEYFEGSSNDAKISKLDIWIIAALTIHPNYLYELIDKSEDEESVINIEITLTLLSLSSHRKREIENKLKNLEFEFMERKFKLTVKKYTIRPEGYGAACLARKILKDEKVDYESYHVLDLGGGTITLTEYVKTKGTPKSSAQKAVSGAGVLSIVEFFADAAQRGDTGGAIYHLSRVREALELSEVVEREDGTFDYSAEIDLGERSHDIGDRLYSGLELWARQLIGVKEIFRDIKHLLRKKERLFLTGGGFAIPTVEHFIKKYLGNNELIQSLPDCEKVNITGIN